MNDYDKINFYDKVENTYFLDNFEELEINLDEKIQKAHYEIMETIKHKVPFDKLANLFYLTCKKYFKNYDYVYNTCFSLNKSENGYNYYLVNFDKLK